VGLPLDGGESEGNVTAYTGKGDCEGLRLLARAGGFFLLFLFAAEFRAEDILYPFRSAVSCFD